MSQLAFDKEGHPFQLLPQTESLWVRRFRNPGARGTCEVLYDEEDELLHIAADGSLADLRDAVNQVPALYRLDQCDDTGEVIAKATPAYVTIDPPRNGLLTGGTADPLVIVRELAAINADVSKTLADRAAGMMEAMAGCMRDMRAALGGDANQRLLGLMAKVAREKDAGGETDDKDEDDDEDEEDERDDEDDSPSDPPNPLASLGPLAPMVAAMAPKIGEAIAAKVLELMAQFTKAPPAAATASTTATASAPTSGPTPSGATSDGAAAGASSATSSPAPSAAPAAPTAPDATVVTEAAVAAPTTQASTVPATTATAPTASAGVRNGVPTPEQLAHLLAIRTALWPREVAIVDGVIARMDGPTCAQWIGELSSMTVDQAVARVRSLIPGPTRGDPEEA